jgi:hypothetical protein
MDIQIEAQPVPTRKTQKVYIEAHYNPTVKIKDKENLENS